MKSICYTITSLFLLSSCANIVAPTGGEKDALPPQLLKLVESVQKESGQLEKVYFLFDEYIGLNQWENHFYISPPIGKRIVKKVTNKSLELYIKDTLKENTTYFLSLNHCIKDINEGNILEDLQLIFSTSENIDSLSLSGKLQDSYTLAAIENAWIMLFKKERNDSVIFKEIPNYIVKTDKDGFFNFPNLNSESYTVVALTDFDFIYNKEETIAFHNNLINAEQDSFITLSAFDPIVKIDSALVDAVTIISDSTTVIDTIAKEEVLYGNLLIITASNSPSIFQLLQNEKVITEFVFTEKPYSLTNIIPGKYQLKYIADTNKDGIWNCGNWETKIQPEKVINYQTEITIRSNWDWELEWDLE